MWKDSIRNIVVQGLSTGFDILWRPRRSTKNNFLVKTKASVYCWGLGIWEKSTSFWKSSIGWPQQPPSERVPYISEKLDFWWSIPQKMISIGHFGAIDVQTIRIRICFEEIGLQRLLRPLRLQRLPRSMRLQRFLRTGKAPIRSSRSFRFLNSLIWELISLYFDVLEKKFFDRIMKTYVEF